MSYRLVSCLTVVESLLRERKFIDSKEEELGDAENEMAFNMRQSVDESYDQSRDESRDVMHEEIQEKSASSSSYGLEAQPKDNSNYFKLPRVKIEGMHKDQRARHNRQVVVGVAVFVGVAIVE